MLKILLIDYMPHKITIIGAYYADLLCKLIITSKEKRRGKLTQVLVLLHYNAPNHRSHVGQAAVLEREFKEMRHPPHSPDHILLSSVENLCRQRFSTDDELK